VAGAEAGMASGRVACSIGFNSSERFVHPGSAERTARLQRAAKKVRTAQESNTSGAKALISSTGYGPAKAVP
jgi:hypothetical protein